MFRRWLAIFKKDTLMDKAYQRSFEMLEITRKMYLEAKESLRHKEDTQIKFDIYDLDSEINRFEREVRRNVFNYLTVSGGERLTSGLILVSIIIDIERIGDYTKNIVELALNHPGKLHGGGKPLMIVLIKPRNVFKSVILEKRESFSKIMCG